MEFAVSDTERLEFHPYRLLIVGFAGRDQTAVLQHINELKAQGIPAPSRVPETYEVAVDRLSSESTIQVNSRHTSGEVEAVLLLAGGAIWLGVGSDHTDRDLERVSIGQSKAACPKVISRSLWRFEEVADHWDDLVLRSWTRARNGELHLYQEGRLEGLLPPDVILKMVEGEVKVPLDQTVIFTGTVPLIGGEFRYTTEYHVELIDEVLHRALYCPYKVAVVQGKSS